MEKVENAVSEVFDERANEEDYFTAKEHELIADLRLEFHKAQAARRAAVMTTCPKCSGRLNPCELLGRVVERCENCQGHWLYKGDLEILLRQQALRSVGAFPRPLFCQDGNPKDDLEWVA